jgi:ABC-type multidrug transport system ATPase subunit
VLGFDPAREPLQVKRRVGYLPDSVGFYDHLTAIENLSSDLLISRNFKDFWDERLRG